MESFVYIEIGADLSTCFSELPVEKPVENVENSCVNVELPCGNRRLCQLVTISAGFLWKDICFHCEYSENKRFFVGNIENTPLLLGKLMVSSKGWRENQL